MKTPCMIGIESNGGSVRAAYCCFDGHPERVGVMLKMYYNCRHLAKALIDMGALKHVGGYLERPPESWNVEPGMVTEPYAFDDVPVSAAFKDAEEFARAAFDMMRVDYCYLWAHGRWLYCDSRAAAETGQTIWRGYVVKHAIEFGVKTTSAHIDD